MIRWQGIIGAIALRPHAVPAARTAAGEPALAANWE